MSDFEVISTILMVISIILDTVVICYMIFHDDNKK